MNLLIIKAPDKLSRPHSVPLDRREEGYVDDIATWEQGTYNTPYCTRSTTAASAPLT